MARSTFHKAGNINLKGKRSVMLRCRCCVVTDLRPKLREQEARADLRQAWNCEAA